MPSYRSQNKTKPTNIKKGISFFTVLFGIAIGYTKDVSQRMRNIFDILLQSMFEIAKSVFLENAAIIWFAISNYVVSAYEGTKLGLMRQDVGSVMYHPSAYFLVFF